MTASQCRAAFRRRPGPHGKSMRASSCLRRIRLAAIGRAQVLQVALGSTSGCGRGQAVMAAGTIPVARRDHDGIRVTAV